MTDNLGASPVCHQCLQALLYVGLTCTSLGLCTWVQMHPWLQLVDDGAELRSPLTLHLYLIHCVLLMDPKSQGREFHVCTLPEYQVMQKKKRPQMLSTGRDNGAHLNPPRGELTAAACMGTSHLSQELTGAPFSSLSTWVVNSGQ